MQKIAATRTVYSYYFPEVRRIIDTIVKRYPHEVFLKSITLGLDAFHIAIVNKYVRYVRGQLTGIEGFPHRYVTSGGSEAIFHTLVRIRTHEPKTPVYVLRGEYQGYKEYGKELGIRIRDVSEHKAVSTKLLRGIFFISNPSARDGMILPNSFIKAIAARHRIVLDVTYVGLTRPYPFDIRSKNIILVISSLSKPFGLYYYRIGFTFSRFPMPTLEVNKWFKNIFSLIIADAILTKIKAGALYRRYAPLQKKVVKYLNRRFGFTIRPADVLILGTMDTSAAQKLKRPARGLIKPYQRGNFYRFCLTPYFLEYEKHKTF